MLEEIRDAIKGALQERYPRLGFLIHKLQAPGFSVEAINPIMGVPPKSVIGNPAGYHVKITNDWLLFDIEPPPDKMVRRLLELDYADPQMMDKLFAMADRFVGPNGVMKQWDGVGKLGGAFTARTYRVGE